MTSCAPPSHPKRVVFRERERERERGSGDWWFCPLNQPDIQKWHLECERREEKSITKTLTKLWCSQSICQKNLLWVFFFQQVKYWRLNLLVYIMRSESAKASTTKPAAPDSRPSIPIISIRSHLDSTCTGTWTNAWQMFHFNFFLNPTEMSCFLFLN